MPRRDLRQYSLLISLRASRADFIRSGYGRLKCATHHGLLVCCDRSFGGDVADRGFGSCKVTAQRCKAGGAESCAAFPCFGINILFNHEQNLTFRLFVAYWWPLTEFSNG